MVRSLSLLVMAVVLSGLLFGCAVTGNNLFAEHNISKSNLSYKMAQGYCDDHATGTIDECLNSEFGCAVEVAAITNVDNLTTSQMGAASRKSIRIMKEAGVYRRWLNKDLSFCELQKIYEEKW